MLTATKRTVRLRPELERSLRAQAERLDQPPYRILLKAIETGLAAIAGNTARDVDTREIADEVGAIGARIVELERVLDRTLFVACAAYAYARNAALGSRPGDEIIAAEARAAFERQRGLASEVRP